MGERGSGRGTLDAVEAYQIGKDLVGNLASLGGAQEDSLFYILKDLGLTRFEETLTTSCLSLHLVQT